MEFSYNLQRSVPLTHTVKPVQDRPMTIPAVMVDVQGQRYDARIPNGE